MAARRWDEQKLIEMAHAFEQAIVIGERLHLRIEPTAEVPLSSD